MRSIRARAVLSALAATAFAAIAPRPVSATARTDAGATPQATTTITFWQTMNDEETKTLKSLVASFQKANKTIKVNMVYVPFDQAQAKYATAAQGGKAPDVMRAEIAWIADYAARGFLADLTKNDLGRRQERLPGVGLRVRGLAGQVVRRPAGDRCAGTALQQGALQVQGRRRAELDGQPRGRLHEVRRRQGHLPPR